MKEQIKKKVGRPKKAEVEKEQIDEVKTKYLYAARLFNKGWSRNKVSEELQSKYNVSQSTAARYIGEAYKIIAEKNDNLIKTLDIYNYQDWNHYWILLLVREILELQMRLLRL